MIQATRVMVFDRLDAFRFDLDPRMVSEAPYVSEVNGEHSVAIVTTMELEKTNRLLVRDCMGVWHEYVVAGITETHASTKEVEREYYCVWSLQYDLSATFVDDPYGCGIVPGHKSVPKPARTAMDIALSGTSRWRVGSITVTTMAAASFYRRSGWEAMKTVVEKWGGEVQATITVDKHGVVSRSVDLLTQVGATTATRRFDYGHDVTSIKRTYSDEIWPCRIIPLGKSQETEAGGYTRRPTIESVNGGCMWLEDSAITPLVRVSDGSGGWEYPTLIVENDTYEEPADLKAWAEENITDYTRPQVSYEANVAQFVRAGLNPHGVALGDAIVVVDHTFGTQGLRINARVKRETGDLYDASKTAYTIGTVTKKLSNQLSRISKQLDRMTELVDRSTWYQATGDYLSNLLGRINAIANAEGGYTYITEGEGWRTYDYPVSDPLAGDEATKVVEVKGGTIRIANSRTATGDWDWRTVFVSGHVAAALVTAACITAGFIGNASGSAFWDLDNDDFRIGATASVGGRTVQALLDDVDSAGIARIEYGTSTASTAEPTNWSTTVPTSMAKGTWLWVKTTYKNGGTVVTKAYAGTDGIDGTDGTDGVGISSTAIEYGTSDGAATQPTSWSPTTPGAIAQGKWLWVKATYTYSDQSSKTTYTKSYVGTDGNDGTSVYVASSGKQGGTTTVTLSDGTVLTINDGEDGTDGRPGADGTSSYVHLAWANSADGTADFSTSVSADKRYIGVYADGTQADSTRPADYSWSLIKGADGTDGVGIRSVVPQYYLSTSSTSATGGSWSTSSPSWSEGHYIWTRTLITWDTSPETTSTTDPVYDVALTQANRQAKEAHDEAVDAAKVATNYLNFSSSTGLDIGYSGTRAKVRVNGSGTEVFDGDGNSLARYSDVTRIGRIGDGYVLISHNSLILFDMDGVPYLRVQDRRRADGLYVYEHSYKGDASAQTKWRHSITEMPEQGNAPVPIYAALDGTEIPFVAYSTSGTGYPTELGVFAAIRWYLGYANVMTYNRTSSSSYEYYELPPDETVFVRFACECDLAKDYTIGTRVVGEDVGIGSIVMGHNCSATKRRTIAIGASPDATAQDAMAIGTDASASGQHSVAIGDSAAAMETDGVAIGHGAVASGTSGNGYRVNIRNDIMTGAYGKPLYAYDRDISVATTVLTTSSLFTFTNFRFVRSGRVAMLSFDWSYSFAISVPATGNVTDLQIGTLIEGFRPVTVAHPVSNGNGVGPAWYHISTGGALILCAVEGTGAARTIAANTTFNFACTYITA